MGKPRRKAPRDLRRRAGRTAAAPGGAAVTFSLFLWGLVWAGMFTGLSTLTPFPSIHDRLALFQGLRALFPVAAAYIALLWALAARARFRFRLTTLGLLTYYGALRAEI